MQGREVFTYTTLNVRQRSWTDPTDKTTDLSVKASAEPINGAEIIC